jgi:hypothetical protein
VRGWRKGAVRATASWSRMAGLKSGGGMALKNRKAAARVLLAVASNAAVINAFAGASPRPCAEARL